MDNERLLTLSIMARRLRVTVAWLRGEAEAGRVPCLRAGRQYLFDSYATEQALLERAAQPTPARQEAAHA